MMLSSSGKRQACGRALCATALLLSLSCLSAVRPHAVARADTDLKPLWQIGQADRSNAEFALAPGRYEQYSEDGFYVVGRSNSRQTWPCIQPGPQDSWAGSRSHAFQIVFALHQVPTSDCRLVVRVLDTQGSSPPRLRAQINDYAQEVQLPKGGGDASLSGQLAESKPFVWSVPVPAAQLKAGVNRVSLTTLEGSWLLYDAVSFDAPPGAEAAPTAPVWLVSVQTPPFLLKNPADGTPRQAVSLRVHNYGPVANLSLRLNGTTQTAALPSGITSSNLLVPEVKHETAGRVAIASAGQLVTEAPVTLRPVRHQTIYLLPHSHVDIGYTQPQEEVRLKQIANLREALQLIKRTANYPVDARFKWNLEVMWPMQDYLRAATPAQKREFLDAVRSGKLILNGYYGNLLTGLCAPNELLRATGPSLRIAQQAGVRVNAVMQDDTPGYTWGNVTALSQAGIKYFSLGPNRVDRIGSTRLQWEDKPFYWVSPSGRSKVLCWMTYGGYSLGHDVGKQLVPLLPQYLNDLNRARYPYDISCLRWCVNGDNGAPDEKLSDTVRDWNAKYAFPHLVIAGTNEPFVALERRYSKQIPTHRGDFTPYWEDGVGSTARETALKRNATDRLTQAAAVWAIRKRSGFSGASFRAAWEDAMLYSEHTWGAFNSTSEPDIPFVKTQWAYKQAFALRAEAASRRLLAQANGAALSAAQIDVFNTTSWPRTDLALIPAAQSRGGDRVLDELGRLVPSQRLADGTLAVLVRDLAPFSARRYSLRPGKATTQGSARAQSNVMRNESLTARIDPQTGAITELRMVGLPGNLVDTTSRTAVNDYFYLLGDKLSDLARSALAKVTVEDAGPLVATLRIDAQAPGARHLTRRVRLTSGIARVDLSDTIDKTAVRAYEGVHIGFGFNVPNATMRMDMPLAVVRPEQDQLPAANKNWYPVQHWVDVSNARYGVTWATVDAPLVEVGDVTAHLPGFVGPTDPRWIQRTKSSATFYSWVMNNHWHTNYKADQEGPVTFRYALAPHGVFAPENAARFGQGVSQPLLALPASGPPVSKPLLQVSSPAVTVSELKPSDDGTAWMVRLWGASGREQNVRLTWQGRPLIGAHLSDATESVGAAVGPIVRVPGYDIVTLRIARG